MQTYKPCIYFTVGYNKEPSQCAHKLLLLPGRQSVAVTGDGSQALIESPRAQRLRGSRSDRTEGYSPWGSRRAQHTPAVREGRCGSGRGVKFGENVEWGLEGVIFFPSIILGSVPGAYEFN